MANSYDRFYIGGEWVPPGGGDLLEVISPVTQEVIATVPDAVNADMDAAVAPAREAFDRGVWPTLSPAERAAHVDKFAQAYLTRCPEMSSLITEQMGCPISFSSQIQAPPAGGMLQYFTELAGSYPWEERRAGIIGGDILVRREPVGVVGVIAPWNVPQLVIMSRVAPALIAGCTVVIKPAPETPLDTLLLAEIADEAGLPPGVLNVVPAGREVGEHLVRNPGVDKIGFTGSTAAGRRVGSICGEMLKRCTLELGGKSAAIILDDADLAAAVEALRFSSFMINGESCLAHSRILASRDRYDEVVDAVTELAKGLRIGDPFDESTDIGPLFAERHRERVEGYLEIGRKEGARVTTGGGRPGGFDKGWYVEPTVFADVDSRMRIAQEEIFGPVVAVIPFDDVEDAVAIANDSDYGLAGTVFTGDAAFGLDIARRIRTGSIGVNGYMFDLPAPVGGYKCSGIGREMGPEGLDNYVELKSITPLGE
ncbi:MAG TPA: aldehyde dehydrogenase [Acidimicrobiales bacterium]